MTRLLQRLQRRAVVVLAWLVLALAAAPAAVAAPLRAHAALICAAPSSGAAVRERVPAVARSSTAPRSEREAASAPELERSARVSGRATCVASPAAREPRSRCGRRLYLENCSFLC